MENGWDILDKSFNISSQQSFPAFWTHHDIDILVYIIICRVALLCVW